MISTDDFLVYMLYHDDASKEYAEKHYSHFSWIKLVKIETQKYFESHFIAHILPTFKEEWKNKKYVGVLSWKANKKVTIDEDVIKTHMEANADIIPLGMFKAPAYPAKMLQYAQHNHPNFIDLWAAMCEHLGYSVEVYLSEDIPAFYYNYWIVKSSILDDYLHHLKLAYKYLETESSIQKMLHEDSTYAPDIPIPNISYITHHCFLLERLPCLYFWSHDYLIIPTRVTT